MMKFFCNTCGKYLGPVPEAEPLLKGERIICSSCSNLPLPEILKENEKRVVLSPGYTICCFGHEISEGKGYVKGCKSCEMFKEIKQIVRKRKEPFHLRLIAFFILRPVNFILGKIVKLLNWVKS